MPQKKLQLTVIALIITLASFAQVNLVQRGYISFPGERVAGVWHYVDSLNREYALVGTEHGISIVDVTVDSVPVFLFEVPGISNLWHEVKTMGPYAYATTQGTDPLGINDGLQIIDLRYLPDSAPAHYWHGDSAIAGMLHYAHTVTVDSGYVYINGHNINTGYHKGVLIASLADPLNPHFIGADTVNYCHDSFVRGDTLWSSEIYNGQFAVYDISNRANPVLLATQATPSAFNHNTWLSDNSHTLFTTDEHNHAPLASYDVSDLANITLLDKYKVLNIVNPSYSDEVHNVRVLNDFLVNACYGSQVTIVDATHPDNLIETGNFPILAELSWDVDPYLPSGKIIATGMTTGLYIFAPTYVRACYLEGTVTDSTTTLPINTAQLQILTTYVADSTDFTGVYKTGYVTAGTYDIQFSKAGYVTKTITGVTLANGVLTTLDVQLVPINIGINELSTSSHVSVVPNPFSESTQLNIDEKLFSNHVLTLSIKDVTGRVVRKVDEIKSSSVKIRREDLGSGMYFYEVSNKTEVVAKGKLVVE